MELESRGKTGVPSRMSGSRVITRVITLFVGTMMGLC